MVTVMIFFVLDWWIVNEFEILLTLAWILPCVERVKLASTLPNSTDVWDQNLSYTTLLQITLDQGKVREFFSFRSVATLKDVLRILGEQDLDQNVQSTRTSKVWWYCHWLAPNRFGKLRVIVVYHWRNAFTLIMEATSNDGYNNMFTSHSRRFARLKPRD